MDLNRLTRRAREAVDKRGGMQGVKDEAAHLRDIARQKGSMADKAKQAVETMRNPGATGGQANGGAEGAAAAASPAAGEATAAAATPAEGPEAVQASDLGQAPVEGVPEEPEVMQPAEEVHGDQPQA